MNKLTFGALFGITRKPYLCTFTLPFLNYVETCCTYMWQARSVVLEIRAFQEILTIFFVWDLSHLRYFYSGFFQGVKDCWPSGRRHRSEERESNKITTRNVKKGATTFALETTSSLVLVSLLTF